MFGQKTIPDPHQEIVDQYLKDHNPCEPSKPLRIDLRKYLDYAEEHHITDPSERKPSSTISGKARAKQEKAQPPMLRAKTTSCKPGTEDPSTQRTPLSTSSTS